jgi:hypothetical protein
VAQGVGPEFKPQYTHTKKKKEEEEEEEEGKIKPAAGHSGSLL